MRGALPIAVRVLRSLVRKFPGNRGVYHQSMSSDSADIIREGAPWNFRGEGNSSLALASPGTHQVLRLRKVRSSPSKDGHTSLSEHSSSLQGIVNYVDHVIRPMLPCAAWIPTMRVLRLPEGPQGLHQLVHQTRSDRDLSRLLDSHSLHDEAILMRDLCFLPEVKQGPVVEGKPATFCVEIKPKEGVLPAGEGVHPARQRISKYQMKQQMKVQYGRISQANDYDPLDLFSGDPVRIKKSLHTLVRNPQNNFRVFIDGNIQFDSRNSGLSNLASIALQVLPGGAVDPAEAFLDLVLETLKKPWSDIQSTEVGGAVFPNLLKNSSILGGLFNAQRACTIDIEPLYPQYLHLCQMFRRQPGLRQALGVDGPNYGDAPFWTGRLCGGGFEISAEEKIYLENCRSYLAASTVKDCSVFLTFQPLSAACIGSTLPVIEIAPGLSFAFFTSLVDLDPKPFERIEKHFLESQTLIELTRGLH